MEKKTQFSIWYFVAVFFTLILLQRFFFMPHVQDVTYSEFRELVGRKLVTDLVVSSQKINGKLREGASAVIAEMRGDTKIKERIDSMQKQGHPFTTIRMEDPDLVNVLEEKGIQYQARIENTWFTNLLSWIVPIFIFFALWSYLFRKIGAGAGGGLMSIGKSKARVYVEDETKVTFADAAGVDEAEEELKEIIDRKSVV